MHPREHVRTVWLIFAGLAIGLVYIYGGFVPGYEWLIAPAVAAGITAAFWMGLRRSRSVSPLRRLGSAITWLILFCFLLTVPAALRWTLLRLEVSTIPMTADAANIHREIHVVRFEGVEPFLVGYVTHLSSADIDTFLRNGLNDRAWTIDIVSDPDEFPDIYPWIIGTRLNLQTKGVQLRQHGPSIGLRLEQVYNIHRGRRYVQLCVCDAGSERWVYAYASHDEAPRWVRKLGL